MLKVKTSNKYILDTNAMHSITLASFAESVGVLIYTEPKTQKRAEVDIEIIN